jgi:hypothetical protein
MQKSSTQSTTYAYSRNFCSMLLELFLIAISKCSPFLS